MRVVFIGASEVTLLTAQLLIGRNHEVVIVETDREKIENLRGSLDCGFLHGDGSRPAILREANPKQSDILFCLTDDDRANMIASLVGRSLGFPRVVTSIKDPELVTVCEELGLDDTIVPSLTISRYLADMVQGLNILELSSAIKGDARCFAFVLREERVATVADLELPAGAQVICYYHQGEFKLAAADARLHVGDEVVILTHSRNLKTLHDRWEPLRL
ncbi:MAG: TrkA family potassium uptake protein [Pirellulaceae bacterium]|nr:TrkA family potassium uptake protein [Pirellulaceae bacterium]